MQESIGFKQERGDSVKVINAPFKVEEDRKVDIPLWKQPGIIDMLRAAAVPAWAGAGRLIVFFGMIRPAMKAALAPPPPPAPGQRSRRGRRRQPEAAGAAGRNPPAGPRPEQRTDLDAARALAKENPAAVANIVRSWV